MSTPGNLPNTSNKYYVGDFSNNGGQLGKTVYDTNTVWDQASSFSDIYARYVLTPTANSVFTLEKIGSGLPQISTGYIICIINDGSFDVDVQEDSGTSIITMAANTMAYIVAETAGVPDVWFVMMYLANSAISNTYTPFVNNTVFVDQDFGNDGTAQRENPALPYATLQAAYAAAITNDRILVRPGTSPFVIDTSVDDFPCDKKVYWYFDGNNTISANGNLSGNPLFPMVDGSDNYLFLSGGVAISLTDCPLTTLTETTSNTTEVRMMVEVISVISNVATSNIVDITQTFVAATTNHEDWTLNFSSNTTVGSFNFNKGFANIMSNITYYRSLPATNQFDIVMSTPFTNSNHLNVTTNDLSSNSINMSGNCSLTMVGNDMTITSINLGTTNSHMTLSGRDITLGTLTIVSDPTVTINATSLDWTTLTGTPGQDVCLNVNVTEIVAAPTFNMEGYLKLITANYTDTNLITNRGCHSYIKIGEGGNINFNLGNTDLLGITASLLQLCNLTSATFSNSSPLSRILLDFNDTPSFTITNSGNYFINTNTPINFQYLPPGTSSNEDNVFLNYTCDDSAATTVEFNEHCNVFAQLIQDSNFSGTNFTIQGNSTGDDAVNALVFGSCNQLIIEGDGGNDCEHSCMARMGYVGLIQLYSTTSTNPVPRIHFNLDTNVLEDYLNIAPTGSFVNAVDNFYYANIQKLNATTFPTGISPIRYGNSVAGYSSPLTVRVQDNVYPVTVPLARIGLGTVEMDANIFLEFENLLFPNSISNYFNFYTTAGTTTRGESLIFLTIDNLYAGRDSSGVGSIDYRGNQLYAVVQNLYSNNGITVNHFYGDIHLKGMNWQNVGVAGTTNTVTVQNPGAAPGILPRRLILDGRFECDGYLIEILSDPTASTFYLRTLTGVWIGGPFIVRNTSGVNATLQEESTFTSNLGIDPTNLLETVSTVGTNAAVVY